MGCRTIFMARSIEFYEVAVRREKEARVCPVIVDVFLTGVVLLHGGS